MYSAFCGIEQTNWLNPEQARVLRTHNTWFHYIHSLLPYVATEIGEKQLKNKDRNHKKKQKINEIYTEKTVNLCAPNNRWVSRSRNARIVLIVECWSQRIGEKKNGKNARR